jgi:hypothetical protein
MYIPKEVDNFKGFYTGIGARKTPLYIMHMMGQVSQVLEAKGFVLRSGCAVGADAGFEDALLHPEISSEIYIPNKNFPSKMGAGFQKHYIVPKDKFGSGSTGLYRHAMHLIRTDKIHKGWDYCNPTVKDLHNRNMFQVLGLDLKTPSKFTICFTTDGAKKYGDTTRITGGSGTAVNASDLNGVEVFNLGNDEDFIRIKHFIEENSDLISNNILMKVIPRSELNTKLETYNDLVVNIIKDKHDRFSGISQNDLKKKINKTKVTYRN